MPCAGGCGRTDEAEAREEESEESEARHRQTAVARVATACAEPAAARAAAAAAAAAAACRAQEPAVSLQAFPCSMVVTGPQRTPKYGILGTFSVRSPPSLTLERMALAGTCIFRFYIKKMV